jgi:undecaprenyl-diphosphatase
MASLIETVILGIIQGLTEWLPISSSGHLAIASKFFGYEPSVFYYVLLHIGTLFVVLAFLRRDLWNVLRALVRRDFRSEEGRLAVFVAVGSIHIIIVGLVVELYFDTIFSSLLESMFFVGGALLATGFLLLVSERRVGNKALGYLDSFIVGVAQAVSLLPGVSRSGATISTALLRGVEREKAFKYSFLLSIPAILGAFCLSAFKAVKDAGLSDLSLLISEDLLFMVVGVVVSMVVGYLSLKILLRLVRGQKFHWFAVYCWVAGALVLVSQVL